MNAKTSRIHVAAMGLLLLAIIMLAACGGGSSGTSGNKTSGDGAPAPTPTAVMDTSASRTVCATTDTFKADLPSPDGYSVVVTLGEADCPVGDIGISLAVSKPFVTGAPIAYFFKTSSGEALATIPVCEPVGSINQCMATGGESLSLNVVFSTNGIDKVTLAGSGTPVDLQPL